MLTDATWQISQVIKINITSNICEHHKNFSNMTGRHAIFCVILPQECLSSIPNTRKHPNKTQTEGPFCKMMEQCSSKL